MRPPLVESQKQLVIDNLDLAQIMGRQATRYEFREYREDFISEAYVGLIYAAIVFDVSLGFQFRTKAKWKIRGRLSDARRSVFPKGYRRPKLNDIVPKIESIGIGNKSEGEWYGS